MKILGVSDNFEEETFIVGKSLNVCAKLETSVAMHRFYTFGGIQIKRSAKYILGWWKFNFFFFSKSSRGSGNVNSKTKVSISPWDHKYCILLKSIKVLKGIFVFFFHFALTFLLFFYFFNRITQLLFSHVLHLSKFYCCDNNNTQWVTGKKEKKKKSFI